MDTSKEYIEMCRKAVEVQELWEPKMGDYINRRYTLFGEEIDSGIWNERDRNEVIILTWASSVEGYIHAITEEGETRTYATQNEGIKSTSIWLPRQDQLQDMIRNHHDCTRHNVRSAFYYWYKRDINKSGGVLETWTDERLWLAFVMHEKYGKKWDGNDWVENKHP